MLKINLKNMTGTSDPMDRSDVWNRAGLATALTCQQATMRQLIKASVALKIRKCFRLGIEMEL